MLYYWCIIDALKEKGDGQIITERFNSKVGLWSKISATWIDWLDGKKACLIIWTDITKYINSDYLHNKN